MKDIALDLVEYISAPSRADEIDGQDVVASFAIADVLVPELQRDGYRVLETLEHLIVYKLDQDQTERVPIRAFRVEVENRARTVLGTAVVSSRSRRPRNTLTALRQNARGSRSWVNRVAEDARDRLPLLTEEQQTALTGAANRSSLKRPSSPAAASAIAADVRQRERQDERMRARDADSRRLLAKWLPAFQPGRHPLGNVWQMFDSQRRMIPKVREQYPGALRLGRTSFYKLVAEIGSVSSGGGRRRFLVVPPLTRPEAS